LGDVFGLAAVSEHAQGQREHPVGVATHQQLEGGKVTVAGTSSQHSVRRLCGLTRNRPLRSVNQPTLAADR